MTEQTDWRKHAKEIIRLEKLAKKFFIGYGGYTRKEKRLLRTKHTVLRMLKWREKEVLRLKEVLWILESKIALERARA